MGKAEATVFVRFKPELLILNPNFFHHASDLVFIMIAQYILCSWKVKNLLCVHIPKKKHVTQARAEFWGKLYAEFKIGINSG